MRSRCAWLCVRCACAVRALRPTLRLPRRAAACCLDGLRVPSAPRDASFPSSRLASAVTVKKTSLGGFLTVFAYVLVLTLTFAVIDTFLNFNESVSQSLVPRDDEFVLGIRTNFSAEFTLHGYRCGRARTSTLAHKRAGTQTQTPDHSMQCARAHRRQHRRQQPARSRQSQ